MSLAAPFLGTIDKSAGWFLRRIVNCLPAQAGLCLFLFLLGFLTDRASIELLPPGPPTAGVVPCPSIAATRAGYELRYCPVHRAVADFSNHINLSQLRGSRWQRATFLEEEIRFEADSRQGLEKLLEDCKANDVPLPGAIVLHGRVTDVLGRPIAGAQVDLIGQWNHTNRDKTRADGSFSIFLTTPVPPSQIQCQLRFRMANSKDRFFSRLVTLRAGSPAGVIVSRTVLEQLHLFYWIAALTLAGFLLHHGRQLVRRLRWRPGTCTACGYDLRGTVSERCSECGTVVPFHVREDLASRVQSSTRQQSSETA